METLSDMFPDWSESDLSAVFEESNNDLLEAITRITEGVAKKWDTTGKKKKRAPPTASTLAAISSASSQAVKKAPRTAPKTIPLHQSKPPVKIDKPFTKPVGTTKRKLPPRKNVGTDSSKSWAERVKASEEKSVEHEELGEEKARSPSPARQKTPTRSSPVPKTPPTQYLELSPSPERAKPRTLNQEAAVVMPTNSAMSSIGVRFGSLGVAEEEIPRQPAAQNLGPLALQQLAAANGFGFSNMPEYGYGSEHQRMVPNPLTQGYYADPNFQQQMQRTEPPNTTAPSSVNLNSSAPQQQFGAMPYYYPAYYMPPSQFNYPQYSAAGPVRGAYPAQFGASSFSQPLAQQPLTQQPLTQQPLVQQPLAQQPLAQHPLVQQPFRGDGLNTRSAYQQQSFVEEKEFKAGGRFAPPPGQFSYAAPSNGRGYQQWSSGSNQN